MKELNYQDPFNKSSVTRGSGYKTNNGILRLIPNYDKDTKEIKYLTLINNNDMKVHITAKLIPEVIEMLQQYNPSH